MTPPATEIAIQSPTMSAPPVTGDASTTRARPAWRRALDVGGTGIAAVVTILAVIAIVVAIASHFSRQNQYTVFGHPVFAVLSGSMTPAIRTGDLVIDNRVSTAGAQHLHVGQIATFETAPGSSTLITHRIVGVTRLDGKVAYVTKGDHNNAADSPARPASNVVGVYAAKIPAGGYVLNALHQPLVLVLLLAAPFLWLLSGLFFDMARKADRPKPEPADADPSASGGEQP